MKLSLIFVIAITLSACAKPSKFESKVDCSSGFSTGWHRYATLGNAVVEWTDDYETGSQVYKMQFGETCSKQRRKVY